jgi:uncharacterized protein (TIGR00369 family)
LFFIRSGYTQTSQAGCHIIELMQVSNPDYETAVRESFSRQPFMSLIGATLVKVAPGEVEIELHFRDDLVQQGGMLHGGVVTAIGDTAAGYAAMTLMPSGAEVMSVEFKINLLAPAAPGRYVARGRVVRAGRTITVCTAEIASEERVVATMLGTFIRR